MKKNSYKHPGNGSDTAMNIVIAAVIAAVLGAGIYAVYPKISEGIRNKEANSVGSIDNAGDAAKSKGMKFNKFLETYGLGDEITKDTELSETIGAMTLEKVALYNDLSIEEFRENNYVPEDITNDTKWSDVIPQLPFKAIVGGDESAQQIISMYGLEEVLTPDTPWGEAQAVLEAAQEEISQAMDAAQAAQAEDTEQSETAGQPQDTGSPEADEEPNGTEQPQASAKAE
ncbi:MAG: hypothetical protein J1F64_07970 [Oscillospiraceae bacterium]|nr:hypothetical protein [Oscillospiraceae bacterium]